MRAEGLKENKYASGTGFVLVITALLLMFFLPAIAHAKEIRGSIELNYYQAKDEIEDTAGDTTTSETKNFVQRYNVSLTKAIYPNMTLYTGSLFELNRTKSGFDGPDTVSKSSNVRPFVDLTLRTQLMLGGLRYNVREQRSISQSTTTTDIRENYEAFYGWFPVDLPSMNVRVSRANSYDRDRVSRDSTTETINVNMRYVPPEVKGLDLLYTPNYTKTENKLGGVTTKVMSQSGQVMYTNRFFRDRMSLYSRYNISHQETETLISRSTGEVDFPISPFSGLSSVDDTPADGALNPNPALINGDKQASANINIGLAGGVDRRNIGLDFFNNTEVNTVLIYVHMELPAAIANSFSWDVYTSSNNDDWELHQPMSEASFNFFDNYFEIRFPRVVTRYVKVVVRPLQLIDTIGVPGNFDDIFVTEMEAVMRKAATEVIERKTSGTSHVFNIDTRTIILDTPSLSYNFSYYLQRTEPGGQESSFLSNGLSLGHRFNRVFTGTASVSRDDTFREDGNDYSYLYSASLTAVPIETLSHNLTYGGKTSWDGDQKTTTNAVFLRNTAQLYKGVSLNLDTGVSFLRRDTGEKSSSTFYSVGSGIVPNDRLSFDMFYSDNTSKGTDSKGEETSDFTREGRLSVLYRPFQTLSLYTSFSRLEQADRTRNLQNYGLSWSPFPDGALQFSFSYNESFNSDDNSKTRSLIPSMIWNIRRGTQLLVSSQILKTESDEATVKSVSTNASLRTLF